MYVVLPTLHNGGPYISLSSPGLASRLNSLVFSGELVSGEIMNTNFYTVSFGDYFNYRVWLAGLTISRYFTERK